eukprot:scpid99034/ scgid18258/ 
MKHPQFSTPVKPAPNRALFSVPRIPPSHTPTSDGQPRFRTPQRTSQITATGGSPSSPVGHPNLRGADGSHINDSELLSERAQRMLDAGSPVLATPDNGRQQPDPGQLNNAAYDTPADPRGVLDFQKMMLRKNEDCTCCDSYIMYIFVAALIVSMLISGIIVGIFVYMKYSD